MRYGLQARVLTALLATLLVTLTVVGLVLQRQKTMREDMLVRARDAMHGLVYHRLRTHGEAQVERLAASLANPLYYFDLEAIGKRIEEVERQADVDYVVVYSPAGEVIHDGSREIATFGHHMEDGLATGAIAADAMRVQADEEIFDVSAPIRLGDQRLGGVRVGYSLASVRDGEEVATAGLRASLEEIARSHAAWIAALLSLLVVLVAAMALVTHRVLVRPIRRLADAARAIESGDFDTRVPRSRRNDEIGDLMRGFRRMGESIARHDRDIRRMAYTDSLTGLHNRLAFREILDERLLRANGAGAGLALLFADIDNFKRVNDTLGHDAGDEVLVQFAGRIRDVVEVHAGAAVVARFGGDEFVILLPVAEGEDTREAAGRLAGVLVEELRRPLLVEGRQVFLGISIGVTLFPEDASSAAMLMKNGDIAMYQAKVAGKNCHRFYSRAMDQAVERRVRMEHDLRGAWDRGELSLVYQPLFRMADSRLVGAEALLRWRSPELGMVSPSEFIPVAEEAGLIGPIGHWTLRESALQLQAWQRQGLLPIRMSVNVSTLQFHQATFVETVRGALNDSGIDPSLFEIEVTETVLVRDENLAVKTLFKLERLGVRTALDDFGTGYSSFAYLRDLPIDTVKIDRSFVKDLGSPLQAPQFALALVEAITHVARHLDLQIVAEGIETAAQRQVLSDLGCHLGQGFLFSKPAKAADMRPYLQLTMSQERLLRDTFVN